MKSPCPRPQRALVKRVRGLFGAPLMVCGCSRRVLAPLPSSFVRNMPKEVKAAARPRAAGILADKSKGQHFLKNPLIVRGC